MTSGLQNFLTITHVLGFCFYDHPFFSVWKTILNTFCDSWNLLQESIQMFTMLSRNLQKETNIGLQKAPLILPHLYMAWLLEKKKKNTGCSGRWKTISVRCSYMQVKVKVGQLCPTLCNPMDYTGHAILQDRILDWVAVLFFRVSSQARDRTQVSHIAGRFFTSWTTGEAQENGVGS